MNESQNAKEKEARVGRVHDSTYIKILELSKLIYSEREQISGCLKLGGLWLKGSIKGVGEREVFLIVWWLWFYGCVQWPEVIDLYILNGCTFLCIH